MADIIMTVKKKFTILSANTPKGEEWLQLRFQHYEIEDVTTRFIFMVKIEIEKARLTVEVIR